MNKQSINPTRKLVIKAIKALRDNNHREVISLCQQIIDQREDHAGAHSMLFTSLYNSGELESARRIGGRAAELNPTSEFVLNNQACLQLDAKHPAAAATLLRSLIKQHGPKAKWLYNLGLAQRSVGSYKNAIDVFRQTLQVNPAHERAAFQLADSYQYCGQLELANQQFNYLRLLRPLHRETGRWYIHNAATTARIDTAELKQEMMLWGERFVPKGKTYPRSAKKSSKRLNIGFIVGGIPGNWWSTIVMPVINQISAKESTFVYWQNKQYPPSGLADRSSSIDTLSLSDSRFARQVRDDEIDVIIDVCGMRPGCRQRVLGLRLANKQFGWLAHEGAYISGKISLLENLLGLQQYALKLDFKKLERRELDSSNTVYGINCQHGITHKNLIIWARILEQLPEWSLSLDIARQEIVAQVKAEFSNQGIDPSRLNYDDKPKYQLDSIVMENIARNDVVNISNAILSGATIVALKGELFPARQTAKLLRQLDKSDWITMEPNAYVERVVSLTQMGERPKVTSREIEKAALFNIEKFSSRLRRKIR